MSTFAKTYNVAAGVLKFEFTYAGIVSGGTFNDFDIKHIGKLKLGRDNQDNIILDIYPSNIDIVIDDLSGNNYEKFSKLIQSYKITYPYNFETALQLVITRDNNEIFKGLLDELESDNDSWELTLKFIDGVNKYKDVNIGNPYVLKKLWDKNVIKGYRLGTAGTSNTIAYGFSTISYINYSAEPSRSGYFVNDIQDGDKDTSLSYTILQLFKLLNENIEVDFDIRYKFRDVITGSDSVDISSVYIRRILSNLLGRYVVIKKGEFTNEQMAYLNGNPDYTREQYFQVVYEDNDYKVYRHIFSGTVGSNKWEMGTDSQNVGELLKLLAYNLFSEFGFKEERNKVFFRHRRPLSNSQPLTGIKTMTKMLSVDKVEGVKIDDYYSDNYGKDGNSYGTQDYRTINYKIPLNAFRSAFSFEYRMIYFQSGVQKRVIYFRDDEIGFEDLPMEVISRAEWEAHRNFRDKYKFELYETDQIYDSSYTVDQYNYQGKFKPLEIEKDLLANSSTMIAIQIDQ